MGTFVIIAFIAIIIFAAKNQIDKQKSTKENYDRALRDNDKSAALQHGREYYKAMRGPGKPLTIYDEQAIANDLQSMDAPRPQSSGIISKSQDELKRLSLLRELKNTSSLSMNNLYMFMLKDHKISDTSPPKIVEKMVSEGLISEADKFYIITPYGEAYLQSNS